MFLVRLVSMLFSNPILSTATDKDNNDVLRRWNDSKAFWLVLMS
jgi:hypothetical protein